MGYDGYPSYRHNLITMTVEYNLLERYSVVRYSGSIPHFTVNMGAAIGMDRRFAISGEWDQHPPAPP